MTDEETGQRAEIPRQVRIVSQVFMVPSPVLNLRMIFFSPPREDESRERNSVLGTRKKDSKGESPRKMASYSRAANKGAVYLGRERPEGMGQCWPF